MNTERYTPEQVEKALRDASGIKSVAARMLGCTWHTVQNYIERYESVEMAFQEAIESTVDLAESKILKIISNDTHKDQFSAAKYVTGTRGKDRGWTERVETESTIKDERLDLSKLDDRELNQLEKLMKKAKADE